MMFQIKDKMTAATLEVARRCQMLDGMCWKPLCDSQGVTIVYDRVRKAFGWYCENHSEYVHRDTHPEYIVGCPACGCRFGVN